MSSCQPVPAVPSVKIRTKNLNKPGGHYLWEWLDQVFHIWSEFLGTEFWLAASPHQSDFVGAKIDGKKLK